VIDKVREESQRQPESVFLSSRLNISAGKKVIATPPEPFSFLTKPPF
jgi:hypothetical protein